MFGELLPLLRLAGPVVLAEIGWMSMGLVDTIMVGPLGPAAIAATGLGSGVFTSIAIFGMGLMLGLDALVSRAHGAGNIEECLRWLHQAVWLALGVAPLAIGTTWLVFTTLDRWGLHPEIEVLVGPYLRAIAFGAPPLLLYAAFRRYLQGMHVVRPIMIALLTANIVNAAGNWVFIYGNLGMPALGVEGSAWATTAARAYMAGFLYVAIRRERVRRGEGHPRAPLGIDTARIRSIIALGLPAASQITLEVGVFAAATALAGKLDPVASGSHQIALNVVSFAFMVPLGLASSGAVRVGFALGARDVHRAVLAGWTALAASAVIAVAMGAVLYLWPVPLIRAFTSDVRVVEIGVVLLAVAAAFQLFDSTQAVATGVLRGLGDTRTPMLVNIVGHWVLGLPAGYVLCFTLGWGVMGLWVGLSIGLIFVSVVLLGAWLQKTRTIERYRA